MIFSHSEKKISLQKGEGLKNVLSRLRSLKAERLILEIPLDSKLGLDIENFEALKKEAKARKWTLVVESTDDRILELAAAAGLEVHHPIFGTQEKVVADIIAHKTSFAKRIKGKEIKLKEEKKEEKKIKEEKEKLFSIAHLETKKEKTKPSFRLKFKWSRLLIIFIIASLIFGGYELAVNILPRAVITLQFQKRVINFEKEIVSGSQIFKSNTAGESLEIPGELLIFKQNTQLSWPATGKEKVEEKASGRLTIFNAFSSQPQVLIAGTRFQSPEGKIFRLTDRITIPGAKINNG